MTEADKKVLLAGVEQALDTVIFGKIIIELRGPNAPADIVAEQRTRYPPTNAAKKVDKKGEFRKDR